MRNPPREKSQQGLKQILLLFSFPPLFFFFPATEGIKKGA